MIEEVLDQHDRIARFGAGGDAGGPLLNPAKLGLRRLVIAERDVVTVADDRPAKLTLCPVEPHHVDASRIGELAPPSSREPGGTRSIAAVGEAGVPLDRSSFEDYVLDDVAEHQGQFLARPSLSDGIVKKSSLVWPISWTGKSSHHGCHPSERSRRDVRRTAA